MVCKGRCIHYHIQSIHVEAFFWSSQEQILNLNLGHLGILMITNMNMYILYIYNHITIFIYHIYYYSLADSVNTADSLDPARCAASQLSNTMLSSKTRKFQKASIQLWLLAPCHWPTQFEGRIWPDCSLDFSMWIGNLAALLGLTGDSRSGGFHPFGDVWRCLRLAWRVV